MIHCGITTNRDVVFAFSRNPEKTLIGDDCSARNPWFKNMTPRQTA